MKTITRFIVLCFITLLCHSALPGVKVYAYNSSNSVKSFSDNTPHKGSYHNIFGIIHTAANIVNTETADAGTVNSFDSQKLPFGKAGTYFQDIVVNARKNLGKHYFLQCRQITAGLQKPDIIYPFHYFL